MFESLSKKNETLYLAHNDVRAHAVVGTDIGTAQCV